MGRLDRTIRVAVWALVMGWPAVACGWGRIGHDAVAYIAECNLSPKAQRIAGKVSRTFDRILFLMDGRLPPLARLRAYDLLAYGAGRRAYVLYGRGAQLPGRCRLRTGERHRAVEELQTARRFDGCGQSSLRDSSGRRHALSRPCRLPRRRAVVRRFVQREKAQLP